MPKENELSLKNSVDNDDKIRVVTSTGLSQSIEVGKLKTSLSVDDLPSRVDTLEDKATANDTAHGTMDSRLMLLESAVGKREVDGETVTVSGLFQEISNVRSELANMELGEVDRLDGELDAIRGRLTLVDSTNGQLAILTDGQADLTQKQTNLEGAINAKVDQSAFQSAINAKLDQSAFQSALDELTKSDVGLSNVDNVKQMPISGGVLENYREKLVTLSGTSTAINLSLGNVFRHSLTGNTTYSITNAVNGQAHSFTLIITQTATVRTLTFPASVKWQGGEIPDLTTASKTYVLTFMTVDGGTTWLGMFGGEF